jgi:hypothetical protein
MAVVSGGPEAISLSRLLSVGFVMVILATFPVVWSLGSIEIGEELQYAFADGGDLWLGTNRDGVFVADLTSGESVHLIEGAGIPVNQTTCGVSAFGKVWLGSQDGLYATDLSRGSWERIGTDRLPSDMVNALAFQGDTLWIGTSKGVATFNGVTGEWGSHSEEDGLSGDWVLDIQPQGDSIWYGTMRGGVFVLNLTDRTWTSWDVDDGLISNTVFSISASPLHVFAGTTKGVSVLDRNRSTWTNYGADQLPSPNVYSVLWDPDLGRALVGTGLGLSFIEPSNGTIETVTKVGEIELEKVYDFLRVGDVIWATRTTNLWFSHWTTGVLGFDVRTSTWLRPIWLDVLVDQSGYSPGLKKGFIVQSNEPLEGEGRFAVVSGAGRSVYFGELEPRFDRPLWDAYYWSGDFTDLQVRGNFTIQVEIGGYSGRSFAFEMDNDVVLEESGELIYEFLRYMRCGVAHEYRPQACHLDDGVLPNGTHIDTTGGWHCAGLWDGKYTRYHTYVLFNLLLARDIRPDFFDPIDRDGDGLADILNEAMWGSEFLLKMQMQNGSIIHEVVKVEITDGIIGTPDDRALRGWMPTFSGLQAVAGLAGTAARVAHLYPDAAERYVAGALKALDFYGSQVAEDLGTSVNGASILLGYAQLYQATGNSTYLELAEEYCNRTLSLPFAGYYGSFVSVALGYYTDLNPSTAFREAIAGYLAGRANSRVSVDIAPANPHYPFEIATWRLYIMDPWGAEALYAYRLTGNQTYLDYGIGVADNHLGVNPYNMGMLEGTGTYNSGGYGSYFRSPTNPRAAVPGSIPQGIRFLFDKPHYDISISPRGESAETWLINTNLLQVVALLPPDLGEYPLEVGEDLLVLAGLVLLAGAAHMSRVQVPAP